MEPDMSRNLIPLSLAATLLGGTALADAPNVAVDIAPVHSLVARVMQGVGEPSLIVKPGASPHEYSLRPSEAAALQDADLVFWVSPELTPWLGGAIATLTEDATVTEMLEVDGTTELPFRESALFEAHAHGDEKHADEGHDQDGHDDHDHKDHAGKDSHDDHAGHDHDDHAKDEGHGHEGHDHDAHDHDAHAGHDDHGHDDGHEGEHEGGHEDAHAGHDHGDHDPHAWLSPDNGAVWLNAIAAQLSAADPENASTYFANAAAGREELAALSTEINGILEPVR